MASGWRLLGGLGAVLFGRCLGTLCLGLLAFVGGCSTIPTSGPIPGDVRSEQVDPESPPYALVRLIHEILNVLAAHLHGICGSARSDRSALGAGDVGAFWA